ncbi:hypothetical protein NF552_06440 [Roseomonas mucosa]|nr:hypothetical protein NF552_06440 [Roseomonas mucosa]
MVFRALPFRTAMLLRFDAAWRLGARPVGLLLRHRLRLAAGPPGVPCPTSGLPKAPSCPAAIPRFPRRCGRKRCPC